MSCPLSYQIFRLASHLLLSIYCRFLVVFCSRGAPWGRLLARDVVGCIVALGLNLQHLPLCCQLTYLQQG